MPLAFVADPRGAPAAATEARWIEAGGLAPFDLHALYHGLAYAQAPDAPPVVVWARPGAPHISIGPHQDAALELALDGQGRAAGLEVVRRETGGGSVYVDPDQWVFAFVIPRDHWRGRPTDLYARLLPAVEAAYADLGLPVSRQGANDLRLGARKVGGTGMATLGSALVLVGSFPVRFPAERFAAAVRCPSGACRAFLEAAVAEGMVSLADLGPPPSGARLARALRRGVARALGWVLHSDDPGAGEEAAIREARSELLDPEWRWDPLGRRAVAEGIKLKGDAYLTERVLPGLGRVTVQTEAGRIGRLDLEGVDGDRIAACIGAPVEPDPLARCLGGPEAPAWAEAVCAVAVRSEEEAARLRPQSTREGEEP